MRCSANGFVVYFCMADFSLPSLPPQKSPLFLTGKHLVDTVEESDKGSEFFLLEMARIRREMTLADPGSKLYNNLLKAYQGMKSMVTEDTGLDAMRQLQVLQERLKLGEKFKPGDGGGDAKPAKVTVIQ